MWSFQIGKIYGIPIRIHLTFFFILIWGAYRYGGENDPSGLFYGAFLTLLLFAIVLLHELGHSVAALWFGISVEDITLLPFGGLARLARMPDKPWQEFVVAAAGPAVNVILLGLCLPLLIYSVDETRLLNWRFWFSYMRQPSWLEILRFFAVVNISLLIFNLIPAFPLDGGRIFRAFLAFFLPYHLATRIAVMIGQGFAILLGFVGWNESEILMIVVAIFIFMAGGAEDRAVTVKRRLKDLTIAQVLSSVHIAVQPNYSMFEVASLTLDSRQRYFPVLLGDKLIGILLRQNVLQALDKGQNWKTVAEVMQRNFSRLSYDMPVSEVQNYLLQAKMPVAAVYRDTQFLGLVGFEDIERAYAAYKA